MLFIFFYHKLEELYNFSELYIPFGSGWKLLPSAYCFNAVPTYRKKKTRYNHPGFLNNVGTFQSTLFKYPNTYIVT